MTEQKREYARQLRRRMTSHEKKVGAAVRDRMLGGFKFRRQQVIDGYVADFYCAETGVVLELDGEVHDNQVEYDAHRDRVIAARQVVVIRISNRRIDTEFAAVLSEIIEICRSRKG